jgi:hypothetical protein
MILHDAKDDASSPSASSNLKQEDYAISLDPLPPSKYDSILDACYQQSWEAVSSNDGWKFQMEEENVKVYLKPGPAGQNINFCKGVGTISGTPEQVRCVFASSDVRGRWDEMYNKGEVVERIDTNTTVSYGAFKAPWPVAPRDFVTIGRSVVRPDGSIFVYFGNYEHPRKPAVKKHVRGKLIYSALLIEPVPGSPTPRSLVTYALGNDPCGNIPVGLANAVNVKQPLCVAKIGKFITADPEGLRLAVEEAKLVYAKATQAAAAAAAPAKPAGDADTAVNNHGAGGLDGTSLPQADYALSVGPLPPSKYDDVLAAAREMAWRAATRGEDDGWVRQLEEDGVTVYMKAEEGSELKYCKGTGTIAGTPEQVRCVFAAGNTRPKWDDMYDVGRVLERIDPNTVISYAAFKAPWPVTARDFCSIGRSIALEDGSIFVYYANYEHPAAPLSKKHVRGRLVFSSLLIRPAEDSQSHVTYCVGSDPCGSIPISLINAANIKQPLCVARIGKLIAGDATSLRLAVDHEQQEYLAATSAGDADADATVASPGVWPVRWPAPGALTEDDAWLRPLHDFHSRPALDHARDCLEHARASGGLFPWTDPKAAPADAALPLGMLALRLLRVRGSYLSVLKGLHVYCTVAFGPHTHTSAPGPVFSSADAICLPVRDAAWTLDLTLWGQAPPTAAPDAKKASPASAPARTCLGTLRLSLGELIECSSGAADGDDDAAHTPVTGDPSRARRGMFALSHIPVELDRAATHAAVAAKAQQLKAAASSPSDAAPAPAAPAEPRGLFLSLESCVSISTARWLLRELQCWAPALAAPSAVSTAELALPDALAQPPAALLQSAPSAANPALQTLAGTHAAALVGCGGLSTLSEDDLDCCSGPTASTASLLALQPSAGLPAPSELIFSPELCVRNVARLVFALTPVADAFSHAKALWRWHNPTQSLLLLLAWVWVCTHSHWIPALLCLLMLWTATLAAANAHFLVAHARGGDTPHAASLRQRRRVTTLYTARLRSLAPELSPRATAAALVVQVVAGRVASLLERVGQCFAWGRGDHTTATIGCCAAGLLLLSAGCQPATVVAVAGLCALGWQGTAGTRVRAVIAACVRVHVGRTWLQKDSQIIRLVALSGDR